MVRYLQAINRPVSNLLRLFIGSLFGIIPIVHFFMLGYIYESIKLSLRGIAELPEWKNWSNLFVHGFFVFLISIIWLIPFIIFMLLGIKVMPTSEVIERVPPLIIDFDLLIIGIIFGILAVYLLPVSIVNYVAKERFSEAFRFSQILKIALKLNYFVAWIVAVLLLIGFVAIGNIFFFLLGFLPVVNAVIASIFYFAGMIIFYTIIAGVCSEQKII